jgi:hypothetical protein
MNIINKHPIEEIGYHFIEPKYLPKGKNEYYLRDEQRNKSIKHYPLSKTQIAILIQNGNTADNWDNIFVTKNFNPQLVKNNKFYGLIRLGSYAALYHEFHNFKMPEGIYNSTIISSDIGDHVCIDNVNFLSHYIIDHDVMIANVNELATTDKAKFGNGILKDGETDEKQRMVIEVCNENGGRKIIPFDGMLAGDVFMWSKYRDDEILLEKFKNLTDRKFDNRRGYYGKIGARTVIKNCDIIKDTIIGSDAYIKGANKLKNLTINSDASRKSQIGEGCELVNGIIGYGCRIFYGVKAVRFISASHTQLKYGARLINSYLGNNSTISCCEVLNSLIFPAHEQHHNNSFLCASMIMGQSNIAAGATIGSNHNSRSADGEIIAGRGFWPGLCVSLKHNSKFSSFNIIAKGDYPVELNIPLPFSLISNDVSNDRLVVMPAYWFMYNMYALARNSTKYHERDKRIQKSQHIEFNYLAPDTVNEMFNALKIFESLKINEKGDAEVEGWENSKRKTIITKVPQAAKCFKEMIKVYACLEIINQVKINKIGDFATLSQSLSLTKKREQWINVGGQLIQQKELDKLKTAIKSNKIKSWDDIHQFYSIQSSQYEYDKLNHAISSLMEVCNISVKNFTPAFLLSLFNEVLVIKDALNKSIYKTREKDYRNPFRKMTYDNESEMVNVIGKIEDNTFITDQEKEFKLFKKDVTSLIKKWNLK